MNEKKEETVSIDDLFNKWLAHIEKDGFSRYSYSSRIPQLNLLAEYLLEYNFSFEEAKLLKRKAVEALITERGIKRKDKHSNGNWLKNTNKDFDVVMANYYVSGIDKEDYKVNPDIVAWAKARYGDNLHPQLLKDCHMIGNILNIRFIDEFYNLGEKNGRKTS